MAELPEENDFVNLSAFSRESSEQLKSFGDLAQCHFSDESCSEQKMNMNQDNAKTRILFESSAAHYQIYLVYGFSFTNTIFVIVDMHDV